MPRKTVSPKRLAPAVEAGIDQTTAVLAALDRGLVDLEKQHRLAEQARVELMIDFLAPECRLPMPAVAIAHMDARQVCDIPTETLFCARTSAGDIDFYTRRTESLWPMRLAECAPVERSRDARLLLRVEPGASFAAKDGLDAIRLYLADPALYQCLLTECSAVARRPGDEMLYPLTLRAADARDLAAILPPVRNGSMARSLLSLWFAAPQAFLFVELAGLSAARRGAGEELELLLQFSSPIAARRVGPESIRLNAVPLVQLVKHSLNIAIPTTEAETTLPLPEGTLLYSVDRVRWCRDHREWPDCRPWLGLRHGERTKQYVVTHDRGNAPRLALIDSHLSANAPAVTHINAALTLVNGNVPSGLIGADVFGDAALGVKGELLTEPTPCSCPANVDASDVAQEAMLACRLHREGDVTEVLQALLERCVRRTAGERELARRQIEGIRRAVVETAAPVGGYPGLRLRVDLDEACYAETSPYLFASVLEGYWSLSAEPLTCAQMTAHAGREVFQWPPRLNGRRHPSAK